MFWRPYFLVLLVAVLLVPIKAISEEEMGETEDSSTKYDPCGETMVRQLPFNRHHPANPLTNKTESLDTDAELNEAITAEDLDGIEKMFRAFRHVLPRGTNFVRQASKLPSSGKDEPDPWPSNYWATQKDGIAVQLQGDYSDTVTKYGNAHQVDLQWLHDRVSEATGIDSMRQIRPSCYTDYDCAFLGDQSLCSKRRGFSQGLCIPRWFGICHLWTMATMIFREEPRCNVQYKGQTFNVMNQKALLAHILQNANVETVVAGRRCHDLNPPTDRYGRYIDPSCRDLNPGFFHLMIANIVGIARRSFIIDMDEKAAVWNQPLRSYKVHHAAKVDSVTAGKLISPLLRDYRELNPRVPKGTQFVYFKTTITYIVEADAFIPLVNSGWKEQYKDMHLEYIVELNPKGNIIGGEWVGRSKMYHPDFFWVPLPDTKINRDLSVGGIRVAHVLDIYRAGTRC